MNKIKFNFKKTTKLLQGTLLAAVLVAFGLVGCEEEDLFTINAPEDHQARLDSAAAARAARNSGDTTYIDLSKTTIGETDFSSAFWSSRSDYMTLSPGKRLLLNFTNYNGGAADVWKNWVMAMANLGFEDPAPEGYYEYFVLRADGFGWAGGYDAEKVVTNYPEVAEYMSIMDGAEVTIEIDYAASISTVFVTATAVGRDGTKLVMTYNQFIEGAVDLVTWLTIDGSYIEMESAYIVSSIISDSEPVSIQISGAPELVVIGDENFWGSAVATVTYADGYFAEVDSADLSFNVIPDMSTTGQKTVLVAYSKTKLSSYTNAVSTYYNLEVVSPVASIAVTQVPTITDYYFFNEDPFKFDPSGMEVTATLEDNSMVVLNNNDLMFTETLNASAGTQTVDITYEGAINTVSTTYDVNLIQGTAQVGASDLSSGWWGAHSTDVVVASGTSEVLTFYTYSVELNNWNAPATVLRNADYSTEYGVGRWDNASWGDGFATSTPTSDWNWDVYLSNISGSKTVLTVTNHGDNTATLRYDVTYANGQTHFQEYAGITVDSSDLTFAVTTDGTYHVIVNN